MNKVANLVMLFFVCTVPLTAMDVTAAELLDVKPVFSDGSITVDVTADIPMTYTYYKVPGEARAVLDIADADPEKVEPLIVVNKGAVSSISVDKAMVSSMTVSRLVFNLVTEADIHVASSDARKKLTVTFGKGGEPPTKPAVPAVVEEKPAPVVSATKEDVPVVNVSSKQEKEDDPLGIDEPQPISATSPKASPTAINAPVISVNSAPVVSKLEPVVPTNASNPSDSTVVTDVAIGNKTIDIITKSGVTGFKTMTLDDPPRLVIDVSGTKGFSGSSFPVKKFGVEKVRVATNGANVRVVIDSKTAKLPEYKVIKTSKGIQVQFR